MRYTFVYRISLGILSPALAMAGQALVAIPVLPFTFSIERQPLSLFGWRCGGAEISRLDLEPEPARRMPRSALSTLSLSCNSSDIRIANSATVRMREDRGLAL
jgi:hypothetical protein